MGPVVLIGDELACAGFRLAGVDARVTPPAEVAAAFEAALDGAALVLLSHGAATALPAEALRRARRRERPLVAVLPPLAAPAADAGFAARMRALLGIEA